MGLKRVSFIVAWYDFWIGCYWDTSKKRLYILPIPCFGIIVDFRRVFVNQSTLPRRVIGLLDRIQPHLRHIPDVTHSEIQELRGSLAALTDSTE